MTGRNAAVAAESPRNSNTKEKSAIMTNEHDEQGIAARLSLQRLDMGYKLSQALYVVAKLGVADHLHSAGRSVDEVAEAVGAHRGALYRVLRTLASVGVFTEVEPQRFALTPMGECLRTDIPGSMRAQTILTELVWESWGHMMHSVLTGETAFEHLRGMSVFEYLQRNPQEGRLFDAAMTGYVSQNSAAIVETYDFSQFEKVVDVGGGHAALMTEILKKNVEVRGIVYDRPDVIEGARANIDTQGLLERCECIGGDFFESIPAGGDAYLLSSIIHDWDDERSLSILKNCRRVMRAEAKLLLVELVIPVGDEPSFGKLLDLEMLVNFGGQERTEDEFRALLQASGFTLSRIIQTSASPCIIEAVPNSEMNFSPHGL